MKLLVPVESRIKKVTITILIGNNGGKNKAREIKEKLARAKYLEISATLKEVPPKNPVLLPSIKGTRYYGSTAIDDFLDKHDKP